MMFNLHISDNFHILEIFPYPGFLHEYIYTCLYQAFHILVKISIFLVKIPLFMSYVFVHPVKKLQYAKSDRVEEAKQIYLVNYINYMLYIIN